MTQQPQQKLRELINQEITPEEERAWATWNASQPGRDAEATRRFMEDYPAVLRDLAALGRTGADPAGPQAQQLVDRHNQLLLEHGIRERAVAAPSSPAAQALAAELARAAAEYRFGDAVVLCKWTMFRGMMQQGSAWVPLGERQRSAWDYLLRALQARAAVA